MNDETRKALPELDNQGRTPEQAARYWADQRFTTLMVEMHRYGVRGMLSLYLFIHLLMVYGRAMQALSLYLRRDAGTFATLSDIAALWMLRTLPPIKYWLYQRIPWHNLWDAEDKDDVRAS